MRRKIIPKLLGDPGERQVKGVRVVGETRRASPSQRSSCCAILRRGMAVTAVLVMVLAPAGWLEREPLLRWIASVWIVSDPVGPADAVALFGGGLPDRPSAAAEYYRRGIVKRVLVSNVRQNPFEELGAVMSETAANCAVLLKLGVPESAIETFGSNLRNTHEEVFELLAWAERTGSRSIIVPTEIFSTRRVRWMLRHAFPKNITVRVPALDPIEYRQDNWWEHEAGWVGFHTEIIKYIYYRLRY